MKFLFKYIIRWLLFLVICFIYDSILFALLGTSFIHISYNVGSPYGSLLVFRVISFLAITATVITMMLFCRKRLSFYLWGIVSYAAIDCVWLFLKSPTIENIKISLIVIGLYVSEICLSVISVLIIKKMFKRID